MLASAARASRAAGARSCRRPASAQSDPRAISALNEPARQSSKARSRHCGAATADPALASRIATIEGEVKSLWRDRRDPRTAHRRDRDARPRGAPARRRQRGGDRRTEAEDRAARGTAPVERGELDALSKRIAAIESSEKAIAAELAKRPARRRTDPAVRFVVAPRRCARRSSAASRSPRCWRSTKPFVNDPKQLAPLEVFRRDRRAVDRDACRAQLSELAPALYQAAGVAAAR